MEKPGRFLFASVPHKDLFKDIANKECENPVTNWFASIPKDQPFQLALWFDGASSDSKVVELASDDVLEDDEVDEVDVEVDEVPVADDVVEKVVGDGVAAEVPSTSEFEDTLSDDSSFSVEVVVSDTSEDDFTDRYNRFFKYHRNNRFDRYKKEFTKAFQF